MQALLSGSEDAAPGRSGGARRNGSRAAELATFDGGVPPWRRRLVVDATTSGGVLVAVSPAAAGRVSGAVVGCLLDGPAGTIRVH